MANLASSLLDFILDLLRDGEAAAEFQENPQRALAEAGLDDVCAADIRNVMRSIEDLAPVGVGAAGIAPIAPAAAPVTVAAAAPQVVAVRDTAVSPAVAAADSDDVVETLRYIQQTYTYNANTTIDASDSVWAGKDVYQLFGDDSVLAAGGSVAAGGDVDDVEVDHSVEDSYNIDDSFNPENSGNTQIGAGNVNGDDADVDLDNSGNTVDGNGNAVGRGNDVDNTDNSVEVEVEDSTGVNVGEGNVVDEVASGEDNAVGNEVIIRDSGNDNSLDVDVDESFNEDNSTETEFDLDVTTEDILVGDDNVGGDVDVDVEETTTTEVATDLIEIEDVDVTV